MNLEEAKTILKGMKVDDREYLTFSQRLAVQVYFKDYCQREGLDNGIANFLVWLVKDEEIGQVVTEKLAAEAGGY